jgi:aerobic carbon-monoxide dehydrogenase large subunit
VIGKSVLRVEDQRFLTGDGRFIEDLSLPGELHCAFVRSPHPHARIRRIRAPDGVLMLIGDDMAAGGVNAMRCGWMLPGMVEPPRFALARGTVRHVGEPVAAVFAESRAPADDATEEVEVDYEPLPLI